MSCLRDPDDIIDKIVVIILKILFFLVFWINFPPEKSKKK